MARKGKKEETVKIQKEGAPECTESDGRVAITIYHCNEIKYLGN